MIVLTKSVKAKQKTNMKRIFVLVVSGLIAMKSIAQTDSTVKAPRVPFEGIETNWQNGSDRRDSSVWQGKYFTPSVMLDLNYTHSFNNPNDNTVVGSTALARNNEIQLSHLSVGGDLNYQNVRARLMLQFGTRSIVVPR